MDVMMGVGVGVGECREVYIVCRRVYVVYAVYPLYLYN